MHDYDMQYNDNPCFNSCGSTPKFNNIDLIPSKGELTLGCIGTDCNYKENYVYEDGHRLFCMVLSIALDGPLSLVGIALILIMFYKTSMNIMIMTNINMNNKKKRTNFSFLNHKIRNMTKNKTKDVRNCPMNL